MTPKITGWMPDTCECSIHMWWDPAQPAEAREHFYCSPRTATALRPDKWKIVKKGKWAGMVRHRMEGAKMLFEYGCPSHSGLDGQPWLDALFEESRRKNGMPVLASKVITAQQVDRAAATEGFAAWLLPKVARPIVVTMLRSSLTPEVMRRPEFKVLVAQFFYSWAFDQGRVLMADFPGLDLSDQQFERLGMMAAGTFGRGKVVFPVPAHA